MTLRGLAALLAIAAGCLWAQDNVQPEIRGFVVEPSSNLGVAGAEVTLYQLTPGGDHSAEPAILAATSTDARGEFQFHPKRFGDYHLEIKKEGYSAMTSLTSGTTSDTVESAAKLSQEHPVQELRFALTRLGEITGRVIDEDGQPVADLRVGAQTPQLLQSPAYLEASAVTDSDGRFTISKIPPGRYVVRVGPKSSDPELVTQFSETDLKTVDQDLETSFWPGGSDLRSAFPLPVTPGGSASSGTIVARKAVYYRAHVSVAGGDCEPGETWNFSVIAAAAALVPDVRSLRVPCGKSFLVRNLKPGSYQFALWNALGPSGFTWALASAEVSSENVDAVLSMRGGATVSGRVITTDGKTPAALGKAQITVLPTILGVPTGGQPTLDAEGRFSIANVPWDRQLVMIAGLAPKYYLKEIRYNQVALTNGIFTPVNAAQLEIVVNDKVASVSGVVMDGDKRARQAMVMLRGQGGLAAALGPSIITDREGQFQVSGLAPGEYRVLAISPLTLTNFSPDLVTQVLNRALKITLEPGDSKSITLQLADLSR